MVRTGPMIEGVVSPTASKKTITKTLESAATPGRLEDQYTYGAVAKAQEQGGSIQDMANAAVGAQAAGPAGVTSGFSQYGATNLQNLINSGAEIRSGWVIDPTTGVAIGRADNPNVTSSVAPTVTTGNTPVPTAPPGGGGNPPAPPGTPDQPVDPGSLAEISRRAIEGQISALEAQYGLDLASIAALGGEIGQQARFLLAQMGIDQERAQEGLIGNLVGRGVLRSGITARDFGRQSQDFAMRRAEIEMNKGQRLRQLAERAGAASAAMGRGKADVIAQIDQGNLPAEIRSRLLGELQGLTPQDIQRALDAAYSGNQQSLSDIMDRTGQGGLNFSGQQVGSAVDSYAGPVVGGYQIDPSTGLAGEYVGDRPAGTGSALDSQARMARPAPVIDPELLNELLQSGQMSTFQNALRTAPAGY